MNKNHCCDFKIRNQAITKKRLKMNPLKQEALNELLREDPDIIWNATLGFLVE